MPTPFKSLQRTNKLFSQHRFFKIEAVSATAIYGASSEALALTDPLPPGPDIPQPIPTPDPIPQPMPDPLPPPPPDPLPPSPDPFPDPAPSPLPPAPDIAQPIPDATPLIPGEGSIKE